MSTVLFLLYEKLGLFDFSIILCYGGVIGVTGG